MKKKFESKFLQTIRKFAIPVAFCLIFAMVWNSIPVTAEVSDNLQDAVAHILGQRNDRVTGEFEDASTNAKLNELNGTIASLKSELNTVKTKVNDLSLSTSSLSSLDFATIQQMCKAGTISKVAHPGDTVYDSVGNCYIVLGINQDTPCDDKKNSIGDYNQVLTLLFADGYGNAKMNNTNTNAGGWEASDMRTETMKEFVNSLPTEVQKVIGWVKKDNSTADKAFLLSYDEVFGSGLMYTYFPLTGNRDMNNGGWWLRSPYPNDSNYFCGVNQGSYYNYDSATYSRGVFPAICIY